MPDIACLRCHGGVSSHIQTAADVDYGPLRSELEKIRCAGCHNEHRAFRGDLLCTDCHRSIAETAPNAGLRNARCFPDGHPQFRVTLVSDAVKSSVERVDLGSDPKPTDRPNIVFSHAAHLVPEGFAVLGYKPMVCADCHVPEPGGRGFLAITYKGQCNDCHGLKFDTELPWREVPHGDDTGTEAAVEGFYAIIALKGGIAESQEPKLDRRDALAAWVAQKTNAALTMIFERKTKTVIGCFYCHVPDSAGGPFRAAPVMMLTRFLAPARFDHAKHAPIECGDCHGARHSQASSDVLVPGIERCATCHGTETASFQVRSTCASCHDFHRPEFGPLRQTVAAPQ